MKSMEKEEKKEKKKRPLWVKILFFPFRLLAVLLVVILLWFAWCYFDRIKPIDALPPDFAVYLRTDSVWQNAEPLLDLDATLIAMTSPELQKYRDTFLKLKKSKLRKNKFVKLALSRRVDASVYGFEEGEKAGAVLVLDAGFLAGALRLSPWYLPKNKKLAKKLEIATNRHGAFYQLQEAGCFVIKKNLLVFSTSRELLEEAMTWSNSGVYKSAELEAVNEKLTDPVRILANSQKLLAKASGSLQNYLGLITPNLSEEEYTSLNFGITDKELNITVSVPVKQLEKESVVPALLPKFSDEVQYYTLISGSTLKELKETAGKMLPPEKDLSAIWTKSDTISRLLFKRPLEELLFSWTGDEFAVFGIEGKAEPVFALKISDETKRREIFERVFSSYILQSNDSLLVDGIRLPCMQVPSFLMSILQIFDVNVPKPYYLVKDGFIYFSQSPENLVAVNSNVERTRKLSTSENWTRVSSKQSPYSTLSLYYNLERSVPFFVKGNSALSKVLSLYNSGRFDLRMKDKMLTVQLQASAVELESALYIPGFPIELENKSDAVLVQSKAKKSKLVFWLEKDSSVNSLDYGNFIRGKTEITELQYIAAASEGTAKANGGEVWAVTKSGMVYLLNGKLEVLQGYPVLTGVSSTCAPFLYNDSLGLVASDGSFCFISPAGEVTDFDTGTDSGIKATPAVSEDVIAFYEKGFFGGIHIYKNLEPVTAEGPLELDGIAYGSPCLFTAGGNQYVAMITQAGLLYVYDFDGNVLSPFPVSLDGVFYLNVEMADGYLFALSEEGMLYRIGLDGKTLQVKLPYFNAKSGRITVYDYDGKGGQELFITGEGNSLYGFDSKLELLPEFPVSGYGNPLFIDLNGDNKNDCIVITFDSRLSAAGVLK